MSTDLSAVGGLTIRQRRDMGLTLLNVRRVAKGLLDSGEITRDMPREEIAAAVLAVLTSENPKAFADPGVDWDALLSFIERLLAILLPFILGLI